MPPRKSEFFKLRVNKLGINEAKAAEVLGVDVDQVKEWDLKGAPVYIERLLRLWDCKRVGVPGWDGWLFSRGVLKFKKRQWRPENILEDRIFRERLEIETSEIISTIKRK